MEISLLQIVVALLLLDSITIVAISFFGRRWYLETFAPLTRWFPPAKGWSLYYLVLAIFIAWLVFAVGV